MAPWPEQGTEPKAPDKEPKRDLLDVTKTDTVETQDNTVPISLDQIAKQTEEKEVLTLDEGQLKALLDEAITYKNPKDREGKSELFKELLQEVEADESDSKGLGSTLTAKLPRGCHNLTVRKKHTRHQGRECGVGVSTTRGGSLQNLHALGMGGGRRRTGRSGEPLVSARQREGGSLPTNVNVDNDTELDRIICPNYTSRATLEVSGPCKEDGGNVDDSINMSLLQGNFAPSNTEAQLGSTSNSNKSPGLINITKDEDNDQRFSTSMSVSPLDSGALLYPTNPSVQQHVSMFNIPPPQIHIGPDEHRIWDSTENKKVNVSRRGLQKAVAPSLPDVDGQDSTSKGVLGLPFMAPWNRYTSFTFLDFRDPSSRIASFGSRDQDSKTSSWNVDQNQNSLGCTRGDSNFIDRKKQRRVKAKSDRNYILAENIEGFRGGADIDTLMEYIESPSNILDMNKSTKTRTNQSNAGPRNHVRMRAKEEDSRPLKRRSKEKFQRCNSLEEISKTKLEDLTEESSSEKVNGSQQTLTKAQVTIEENVQQDMKSYALHETQIEEKSTIVIKRLKEQKKERISPDTIQDSEFHVVTKKQRKKKRRIGCHGLVVSKQGYYGGRGFPAHDRTLGQDGSSGLLYQYRSRGEKGSSQPRRKSASSVPPSDKSDSSDLDSVHSLPVSSTTSRTKVGKNSVSGGSTPQASYADIARTIASPPDIDRAKYSSYLLGTGSDFETSSSHHPESSVLLPAPLQSLKKDAMTETSCDILKPPLPNEEYPPLEVKTDLYLDSSNQSNNRAKDNNIYKIISKTYLYVRPLSESGNGPRSTAVDVTTTCSKSLTNQDCKRPPVILMDEPTVISSQVSAELTFGFEVNEQLLECEESVYNSVSLRPTQTSRSDFPNYFLRDFDLEMVREYLLKAWENTIVDLQQGSAKYYDENEGH